MGGWLGGGREPSIAEGGLGDFYINTGNGLVYKKESEGWVVITTARGPRGLQGQRGAQGLVGERGERGRRGRVGEPGVRAMVHTVSGTLPETQANTELVLTEFPFGKNVDAGTIVPLGLYILVGYPADAAERGTKEIRYWMSHSQTPRKNKCTLSFTSNPLHANQAVLRMDDTITGVYRNYNIYDSFRFLYQVY
eukprot:scpid75187/ scgid26390/ 